MTNDDSRLRGCDAPGTPPDEKLAERIGKRMEAHEAARGATEKTQIAKYKVDRTADRQRRLLLFVI